MNTQHTPKPWTVDAMGYIRGPESENILENKVNAEYVCRAVNNFQELIDVINGALESEYMTQDGQRIPMLAGDTRKMLEQAVARAEEK